MLSYMVRNFIGVPSGYGGVSSLGLTLLWWHTVPQVSLYITLGSLLREEVKQQEETILSTPFLCYRVRYCGSGTLCDRSIVWHAG